MKVLVTGGAGFIGSHIVDVLVENGYDVCVVDNLSKGKRTNVNPKVLVHVIDITDAKKLEEVFAKEKPDYVIHEAAQINIRSSIEDPVNDAKQNIIGILNVLESCRKFNVKKIIFASSGGAVYGEPVKLPCDENHITKPLCPYGIAKLSSEHYIRFYGEQHKIDYVILRYSNVYGPRQDPKGEAGVISIFIDTILNGGEITIFGDGMQTRDFVYVGDVAQANLLALKKDVRNKIFNIGTGSNISVNQLYNELKETINIPHKLKHSEGINGEVRHSYLEVRLAKKELLWEPKMLLKDGLKKTVEYFKRNKL